MSPDHDLAVATRLVHDDAHSRPQGAVVPPIFQNSTFIFDRAEDLLHQMMRDPAGEPFHYSRLGNPTVRAAERKIADLEGTEDCRLLGSGMAAITAAVMSCIEAGSHVVTVESVYPPVRYLLSDYLTRFGVTVTFVPGHDADDLLTAIRPQTSLVFLEAPSSFVFRMQDVARIAAVCRERGIATILDNTYNTPLHLRPAALGVDLTVESATKYMGGHSDLTAGSVAGTAERLERLVRREINFLGSILHPQAASLLLRGLRTLPLRLKRHEATGNEVASWLETRPEVARVSHVGLPSHPDRALIESTLKGSGGLFSFEPANGERAAVMAFCDALQLFAKGISWGGHESLCVPLHVRPSADKEPRWIVRLFCGLEEPADLIADIARALPHLA